MNRAASFLLALWVTSLGCSIPRTEAPDRRDPNLPGVHLDQEALAREDVGRLAPPPAPQGEPVDLAPWVAKLASPDPAEREAASTELKRMGRRAIPGLRTSLDHATDAEVHARLQAILDALSRPSIVLEKEVKRERPESSSEVAWSPDGRRLLLLEGSSLVELDTDRWEERSRVNLGAGCQVFTATYNPSGTLIAVVPFLDLLRRAAYAVILDGQALGRKLGRVELDPEMAHFGMEWKIGFLDDERLVYGVHEPGKFHLFVAERDGDGWRSKEVRTWEPARNHKFEIGPGGRWVVLYVGGKVEVVETKNWKTEAVLIAGEEDSPSSLILQLRFSPDQRTLILAAYGPSESMKQYYNSTWAYDTSTWTRSDVPVPKLGVKQRVVVDFTQDSEYLLTLDQSRLRAWRRGDWREVDSLEMNGQYPSYLRASPADRRFAVMGARDARVGHVYRLKEPD